ncbi:MAG: acyltransferase [Eubacteriales bacterium]|nr:acyltransferase [Eubacteriales bacterium]
MSDGYCKFVAGSSAKLKIGRGTYFNSGCNIGALESVTIGEQCLFGPNVCVFDNNHDFDAGGVKFTNNTSPVTIGDRCWLASNVVVLKGASIGNNCVIGAGCVIKGNIPDGSIVTCNNDLKIKTIVNK